MSVYSAADALGKVRPKSKMPIKRATMWGIASSVLFRDPADEGYSTGSMCKSGAICWPLSGGHSCGTLPKNAYVGWHVRKSNPEQRSSSLCLCGRQNVGGRRHAEEQSFLQIATQTWEPWHDEART